jgi:transposase-like protein
VVHQIRNSLRYISEKDKKAFMEDLKLIYQAFTKEEGYANQVDHRLHAGIHMKLEEKWARDTRTYFFLVQQLGAFIYLFQV